MLGNNLDNDGQPRNDAAATAAAEDAGRLARAQKEVVPGCSSCFQKQTHPSAVLDYCIQHLGAMVNELDDAARRRVREVLVSAARQTNLSYAGTALYSLGLLGNAEDIALLSRFSSDSRRAVAAAAAIKRIKSRLDAKDCF